MVAGLQPRVQPVCSVTASRAAGPRRRVPLATPEECASGRCPPWAVSGPDSARRRIPRLARATGVLKGRADERPPRGDGAMESQQQRFAPLSRAISWSSCVNLYQTGATSTRTSAARTANPFSTPKVLDRRGRDWVVQTTVHTR